MAYWLYSAYTTRSFKGFSKSGQPPQNRQRATFDGWQKSLKRYNGRSAQTINGKAYSVNYAQRIIDRENTPGKQNFIQLPKP